MDSTFCREFLSNLLACSILNLGEARAYHNEFIKAGKGQPPILPIVQSKQSPRLENVSVVVSKTGVLPIITVGGDVFLAESTAPQGTLTYTLTIHPEAANDISWQLLWKAAAINAFEIGMKILTPPSLDTFSWSRTGQWTDYPAGHIGATCGSVKSGDISFRSTKRDVRWATLSGPQPFALAAAATDTSLHVRGSRDDTGTTLFLSLQVAPPRDFSTRLLDDYTIHLVPGQTLHGAFRLEIVPR